MTNEKTYEMIKTRKGKIKGKQAFKKAKLLKLEAMSYEEYIKTDTAISVTNALDIFLSKAMGIYQNVPQEILEEAGKRGKEIHSLIEKWTESNTNDKQVLENASLEIQKNIIEEIKRVHEENNIIDTICELKVIAGLSKIKGCIDLLYINNKDEIVLVDYKTNSNIDSKMKKKYATQLVAYCEILKERLYINVDKIEIWHLKKQQDGLRKLKVIELDEIEMNKGLKIWKNIRLLLSALKNCDMFFATDNRLAELKLKELQEFSEFLNKKSKEV